MVIALRRLLLSLALGLPACGAAQAPPPQAPPLAPDSVRVIASQLLAPAETRRDLALLAEALERLHPGLTRYQTLAQFRGAVDSLHAWFAEPRSRGATYLALARLTASIRCSHTYLNFWNQSGTTKEWLLRGADKLPFTFALDAADRWIVLRSAAADGAVLAGDTVLAIEGRPTPAIIADLLPLVRGDGDNDGKRRSLLELRDRKVHETIDALLPLLLPPTAGRYRVTVRRGEGHAAGARGDTVVVVGAVPAAVRRETAHPIPGPRPNAEFTLEGSVGLLRVDGFEFEGGWGQFLRESFDQLRRASATALILDLRENEGGSDEGAMQLLRHLIREPLTLPPLLEVVAYDTVPAALRPFLTTWDDDFYDRRGTIRPLGSGRFQLTRSAGRPTVVRPERTPFTGRILVLTGPVNSSASHTLVRLLRGRPGVQLVGTETGGSLRASTGGNLFFLRLPGSGLEVDIPLIGYEWGADQPSGGVPPDVPTPEREALATARAMLRTP